MHADFKIDEDGSSPNTIQTTASVLRPACFVPFESRARHAVQLLRCDLSPILSEWTQQRRYSSSVLAVVFLTVSRIEGRVAHLITRSHPAW